MKHQRRLILIIAACLVLILILPNPVFADVGKGVNWGKVARSGASHAFNSAFPILFLGRMPIWVWVALIIGFIILRNSRKGSSGDHFGDSATSIEVDTDEYQYDQIKGQDLNLEQLMTRDPNFSKEIFLSRVATVFVTLQDAWTNKDWQAIRPFESDQLFEMHNNQLKQFIDAGQTNKVEDVTVLSTAVESYQEDANHQFLNAIIRARYHDYLVDDKSGRVIKGDPSVLYMMTYRMVFSRELNASTKSDASTSVVSCPNCGAQLSINQHGICEYCGSSVTTGAMQWVLVRLEPIEQRTL